MKLKKGMKVVVTRRIPCRIPCEPQYKHGYPWKPGIRIEREHAVITRVGRDGMVDVEIWQDGYDLPLRDTVKIESLEVC